MASEHLPALRNFELNPPKIPKSSCFSYGPGWIWAMGSGASRGRQHGVTSPLHPPGVGTNEKMLWISTGDAEGLETQVWEPPDTPILPTSRLQGGWQRWLPLRAGAAGGRGGGEEMPKKPRSGEWMSLLQRTASSLLPPRLSASKPPLRQEPNHACIKTFLEAAVGLGGVLPSGLIFSLIP